MRTAIYPGSFDPVTNGHIDIAYRACKLFDNVIMAVAYTPRKTGLFTPEERVELLKKTIEYMGAEWSKRIKVDSFDGLLTDYASRMKAFTIVRGLRAVADFEFEFQFTLANRALSHGLLEFVHIMTGEENLYTSSSLVREIAYFGGDVSQFTSLPVREALERKHGKQP